MLPPRDLALFLAIAVAFLWCIASAGTGLEGIAFAAAIFPPTPKDLEAGDETSNESGNYQSWRAVIDALPVAALALDADNIIVHHNALMTDLFPRTRDGLALSQVCRNPELMDAVGEYGNAPTASPEPVVVHLVDRVPVNRRIQATVSVLSRASRDPTLPALLVTFRDLTQQDKIEQMRVDFVANASHELRTPLASLLGYVETLQGAARDDAKARERFLGIMWKQAQRMTRLIDDLLSLSRIEMRLHLPPKDVVDLNEVATYIVQTFEPLATPEKITIELIKLEGPARIRGERDEIVQVLQNLVQNGVKYGREGGYVRVSVTREKSQGHRAARLKVEVADNGVGIAPEHLPRLTERFYRANVTSSREKGGTGLGLAIVKNIVLRHRGQLRIASELGEGSTFTVIFDELGRQES